jgi:hypothetical protein
LEGEADRVVGVARIAEHEDDAAGNGNGNGEPK